MIIGDRFVWAHLGKTGGDVTYDLFMAAIPDLVRDADAPESPSKHRAFTARSVGPLEGKLLCMNIRRLPAWRLSMAHHRARHGAPGNPEPTPLPEPEVMAGDGLGDEHLHAFTGGDLTVDRWLRMEHLLADFLRLAEELRPLTAAEIEAAEASAAPRKRGNYDHDTRTVFPRSLEKAMYEANPVWAAAEQQVYGYLPFQQRWWRLAWRKLRS